MSQEKRQFCWAHLKRDFERFKTRGKESQKYGEMLLFDSEYLFTQVRRVRDGTLKREEFNRLAGKVRTEIEKKLAWVEKCVESKRNPGRCDCAMREKKCVEQKTARTCQRLLREKESMWVFLEEEELELTNNKAERALRRAVI
jgi:transposase